MSGTRSLSPMAPATEPRAALIVAHGSPSAPARPDAVLRDLADQVSRRLSGWRVEGATLAGKTTLQTAFESLAPSKPIIYPLFMSDGWFVSDALPRRLSRLRSDAFEVMQPLGLDPALVALCLDKVKAATEDGGFEAEQTTVLVAAHGSRSDPRPGRVAQQAADGLADLGLFREVRVCFLEEQPFVREAARLAGPVICLPFFAGRAGHVEYDLPEALAEACCSGTLLEPIGASPEIPDIIARALLAHSVRSNA